uniref:PARVUS n=1 Tax=Arundo donax TaxID=35708 RepID=A0A0A9G1M1_ARUDO
MGSAATTWRGSAGSCTRGRSACFTGAGRGNHGCGWTPAGRARPTRFGLPTTFSAGAAHGMTSSPLSPDNAGPTSLERSICSRSIRSYAMALLLASPSHGWGVGVAAPVTDTRTHLATPHGSLCMSTLSVVMALVGVAVSVLTRGPTRWWRMGFRGVGPR